MTAREPAESRQVWWARLAAIVAALVLVVLGVAYYLTYEPSVRIGVRWRDGVTTERRAELERRFRLVNGVSTKTQIRYDLLDTRPENIDALMGDPNLEDTESLAYPLPLDMEYGESWMWIVHRTPGLRAPGVVEALVMTCFVALAAGTASVAQAGRIRRRF